MNTVAAFFKEAILFARDMPPAVNKLLQEAVAAREDKPRAERLLWAAHETDPRRLEVYVALYKFYFYQGRFEQAREVAQQGLRAAAGQGDFPADWRGLTVASADWTRPEGAERFYLYTLKALGFISLRMREFTLALAILDKLHELDPQDQVGGSVILDLARGVGEDEAVPA